ncbi:MAG: septum formation initiator family protein [Tissierellia bacterium]|jgi:cell division protein FtsB|nr:septum formation initiator family protein [Tissierellia bacterium]
MKKKKKRRLKLGRLLLIGLAIYISAIFIHQNKLINTLEAKKQKTEMEIKELEDDIRDLTKELESSHTLEFVEKVARDDLGMVKPREIIYIDENKIKNPFANIFKKDN